ncbi:MAG TPA: DUF4395 domain-containing protein [Microthrixaceae bacterium]|nr:DUF4395 domain-containing protein [Microthrixaceae bacterium]
MTEPFFSFPNPVNDVAARAVATGVVIMALLLAGLGWGWVLAPLTFGFIARVACGPRFSPLGLIATKVVAPRLPKHEKLVPGPPKRFAQAIGVAFTVTASALWLAGVPTAARVVIAMLAVAASLEAALGFCLGCRIFSILMRFGVIPESVCEECNDLSLRYPRLAGSESAGSTFDAAEEATPSRL